MNRKAKFACLFIFFGLALEFVGVFLLLSYDFSSSTDLPHLTLNITDFIQQAVKNGHDENDALLFFYCQNLNQQNENQQHKQNSFFKFRSFFLNNLTGFIICSIEKIYMGVFLILILLGLFLFISGCIRFYFYDLRCRQMGNSICCIKRKSEVRNFVGLDEKVVQIERNSENTCPFIYEELPAFMVKNQYFSEAGIKPAVPLTPPPCFPLGPGIDRPHSDRAWSLIRLKKTELNNEPNNKQTVSLYENRTEEDFGAECETYYGSNFSELGLRPVIGKNLVNNQKIYMKSKEKPSFTEYFL